MENRQFTVDDLRTILRAAAGEEDGTTPDTDILDLSFEDLGYDSIALLETAGRIQREFGVELPDSLVTDARTPRVLIDAVNERLTTPIAG